MDLPPSERNMEVMKGAVGHDPLPVARTIVESHSVDRI